jgi:hypothetical protein
MSKRQNFHRGDLVFVATEYWNTRGFGFEEGRVHTPAHYAIICGSYRDQYGGGAEQRHTYARLVLDKHGQPLYRSAWTDDFQIEYLVQPRCTELLDMLDEYEDQKEEEEALDV